MHSNTVDLFARARALRSLFQPRFVGSTLRLANRISVAGLLYFLSACSLTGTTSIAHKLVSSVQPDLPLLRGYSIERTQNYPIAKSTPLFIAGDDKKVASALAGELSVYFLSVQEITDSTQARPGFVLKFASRAKSSNRSITLTVLDAGNQRIFDTLNIVVEDGASKAGGARRLNAAMSRTAALLAGES
ncbi:MAG: hypothetical protein HKO07_00735 [Pseudomonadales bacterium]|nr:hypothetical protein [Pseudomonadales bacterium]